ncbi:LpxL/LpxP family acyltransferase [Thauera butanivorans]|uniref:LpxL/LpxP family acyltransferase n=1 Tax=Thauera butanivorans TaxID=86174 RepID=UPI0008380C9F|nr:acyl-CoA synthetase [Thauera butanivorans]
MTAGSGDWRRQQERSNLAILRLMVWISLTFGRGIGRIVLRSIAVWYLLLAPRARRASLDYLGRVLGRKPGWRDSYRHIFSFASTIHDRVYLLNDRFDLFDIEIVGAEALQAALARQPGALLVGAHFGSFEVLRAVGQRQAGLKVAMLMYEENARKINSTLKAINPRADEDILPLGRFDSMLAAHDRLEQGYLVGMLADRGLGDDARLPCDFLGQPAAFPVGPWRMAAMLRRPVFFMAGLYLGGNRYQIHFEPLADFSAVGRGERDAAMQAAARAYAERLADFCRRAPCNWFNFFPFWHQE